VYTCENDDDVSNDYSLMELTNAMTVYLFCIDKTK
jgi:hypothetical protein